ncbi:MAG TPA: anti-sigma factor [Solirubrobacterales bacterium]|nr:anti-sigma factor [Solirubrobacterales bacterium]
MTAEGCREWRQLLGAHALGHLSADERAGLQAHLEGCPSCRAEAESLGRLARLLPHGDPSHFGPAPSPPAALGERIATRIAAERGSERRRSLRLRLAFGSLAAALAIAALVLFLLPGSDESAPEQHVAFRSLPTGVKIYAQLEPHSYGTEIRMYVQGVRSGTLCRVSLRSESGLSVSAGTFRYRWGEDSQAVLSSALDLSRTRAIVVQAGGRTFSAPVGDAGANSDNPTNQS